MIIIAFDSYKGCLSAEAACRAAAEGVLACLPQAEVVCLPLSDGGEGMVDCLTKALALKKVYAHVHGPLMEEQMSGYALSQDGKTAYMEMASACGLTLVPQELRNPMNTTTFGVGEMILDAVERGCRRIVMGIGGSATCDGGKGMVKALGSHLQDSPAGQCMIDGHEISVVVASDVTNPLYGPQGAAHVFAPQKGASAEQVALLDERLRLFAQESEREGFAVPTQADAPGAGAAGGLGYALMVYLKATLHPGIEMMLDAVSFEEQLEGADLVLTGEGRSDSQTLMGKVPQGVLLRAQRKRVPVWLLSGGVEDREELLAAGFQVVHSINEGDARPLSELMKKEVAQSQIKRSVQELMKKNGLECSKNTFGCV